MANHTPTYLICITANNNNKYYRMIPKGDTFDVEYGRVGASCQHASYPISQWDKKYNEKIKKGYVDQTDLVKEELGEVLFCDYITICQQIILYSIFLRKKNIEIK